MSDRFESLIDKQIREAQERGEFDNLPGAGKPLPDHNELHDENWWLKSLIRREGLSGLLPATLALRREIQDVPAEAAKLSSESAVRRLVDSVNGRVSLAQRGMLDGPPVHVIPLDPDRVVAEWRDARSG
ncbi:DUF1992 domain-containing protein [Stackebrandtia albiflava]|uniref:DnaJ family domain-containing protein n=1 Tax=Stackebrandtia albiflava TaxID=406432 RepID=UPI0011BDB39E|nr:DUF1992 domain-containing protein [Stackebrandtia albiflava]